MNRFLLLLSLTLIVASCRLEQRTVPPEELPIGCQVDADCVEGRWCDRGQCELPPDEPDTEGDEGDGGEGVALGEGEGEGEGEGADIAPG